MSKPPLGDGHASDVASLENLETSSSNGEDAQTPGSQAIVMTIDHDFHGLHLGEISKLELGIDEHISFNEDELVKLELLRDQEIDALVDHGLFHEEEWWNTECRNDLHLIYPEMNLDIFTGVQYPVRALKYQVKNISLPRIVDDHLIVALRDIHTHDSELNTFGK